MEFIDYKRYKNTTIMNIIKLALIVEDDMASNVNFHKDTKVSKRHLKSLLRGNKGLSKKEIQRVYNYFNIDESTLDAKFKKVVEKREKMMSIAMEIINEKGILNYLGYVN